MVIKFDGYSHFYVQHLNQMAQDKSFKIYGWDLLDKSSIIKEDSGIFGKEMSTKLPLL